MNEQPDNETPPRRRPTLLDHLPKPLNIPDGREGLNPQDTPKSWRCRLGYHDIRDRFGDRPVQYRISSGLGASAPQYWHCKRCERIFEAHEVWDGRRRKPSADQYPDPGAGWAESWDAMDCVDPSLHADKANPFMGDAYRRKP